MRAQELTASLRLWSRLSLLGFVVIGGGAAAVVVIIVNVNCFFCVEVVIATGAFANAAVSATAEVELAMDLAAPGATPLRNTGNSCSNGRGSVDIRICNSSCSIRAAMCTAVIVAAAVANHHLLVKNISAVVFTITNNCCSCKCNSSNMFFQ